MTCDKQNGTRRFGRFQLAEILDINPSTLYKAIKRLEKAKMVTQVSNNKFTIISICNWKLYQGNGNSIGNNKVTTKEQQSNTKQELKNKELKNRTSYEEANAYIFFKETWKKLYGKYPTGGAKLVDYPIKRLVKAYTLESVCNALIWAEANRKNNQFIPTFNNPLDLERKWNSLITQARKEKNRTGKRGIRL
jgi:DNA-binding transcriptional regulator YhcF (GntR family)